jgi:hypothetical protein
VYGSQQGFSPLSNGAVKCQLIAKPGPLLLCLRQLDTANNLSTYETSIFEPAGVVVLLPISHSWDRLGQQPRNVVPAHICQIEKIKLIFAALFPVSALISASAFAEE